mmetsp:Transcript_1720/g.2758  ORF Transcript_1720/g.2758 Transcript_1720/m.2758 type:complete len:81 (-) Transcript_1720:358-600(-)
MKMKKIAPCIKTDGVNAVALASNRVGWNPAWRNNHHCCHDCVVEAYFLGGYCHLNFARVTRDLIFGWIPDRLVTSYCQPS